MRNTIIYIACSCLMGLSSCVGLLNQEPTTELGYSAFWKTEKDALTALYGAYSSTRTVFEDDYAFDYQGEYAFIKSGPDGATGSFKPNHGGNFDSYYKNCYAAINHLNYTIINTQRLLDAVTNDQSRNKLETIIGEARLLRGMTYFRMISMWGDVVYFDWIVRDNAEMYGLGRMPIGEVKKKIEDDFTYAYEKLPNRGEDVGRASRWVALAFRGKLNLYWACWNRTSWPWTAKGGWPELAGFVPDENESKAAYKKAAEDLGYVIDHSGISLYKNGEPGDISPLGKADKLPNYYYLFTPVANGEEELMMVFTHGGTGTGQGEWLLRNFGTRATEGGKGTCQPRFDIADRYQSTITGDFCEPLIPMNPNLPDARVAENSALNPQSYANRDYRMKATFLWDDEVLMGLQSLKETGYQRFRFKQMSGSIDGLPAINSDACLMGYIMRKFVRNTGGDGRNDGPYNYPVLRLADVYLMYAEAANEVYGPTDKAVELVNRIRHRGNLPALKPEKYANKETFFDAIEQERIVELYFEGFRSFDLRRWRMMEKVWGPVFGPGRRFYDTHGAQRSHEFNNASDLTYDRLYIFRIPPSERNKNPKLTQNTPYL